MALLRSLRFAVCAGLAACASLTACASLADLDEPYALAKGGAGGGGGAPTCPPERLPPTDPPRPTQATPGGEIDFFAAIDRVSFGEDTDENAPCGTRPLPGLDLDKMASTDAMPACQPAANPDGRNQFICDGAGGVDNQNANLTTLFGPSTRLASPEASAAAAAGKWSIVFRVSDYNGELEDDAVTVALYPTITTVAPPRWDGTDDLPIDQTSVMGSVDAPRYVTSTAYVTCGMLVASIGRFPFDMKNPPTHILLSLEGFRLIAKIRRDAAQRFELEGVMAGVWPLSQAWVDLEADRVLDDGRPICADDETVYNLIRDLLCVMPDTSSGPVSISAPCDAFSMGTAFGARPVARPTTLAPPQSFPAICMAGQRPVENMCE